MDRVFSQLEVLRDAFSEIYTRENNPNTPASFEEEDRIRPKIERAWEKIRKIGNQRLEQILRDVLSSGKLPVLIDADILVDDFVQKERELEGELGYKTVEVPVWYSVSKIYEKSLRYDYVVVVI